MSGTRRVVFASDLHLGSNPTLDDFTRDVEFESFLDLPELTPSGNGRVELGFLGDSFDLWQAVSEDECHQEKSQRIDLAYVSASEAVRLDESNLHLDLSSVSEGPCEIALRVLERYTDRTIRRSRSPWRWSGQKRPSRPLPFAASRRSTG